MDFYLVRHGEAFTDSEDPQRSLTPAGRADVERVARAAAARVRASAIFHSGILRAKQTAEIIAAAMAPGVKVEQLSGLRPDDDPAIVAAELQTSAHSILLVGHLPHMNRLVALLVTGDSERRITDFGPATMVCCSRQNSRWMISWILTPHSI